MSDRLLIATDYQTLRHVLNERRLALKMSMIDVDCRVGWADGFASKVFCGKRNFGAQSLGELLQAFGVALCVVELPKDGRTSMTDEQWSELARKAGLAAAAKRAQRKANIAQAQRLHKPRDEWHERRRAERAANAVEN